jgi:hypothetical protein
VNGRLDTINSESVPADAGADDEADDEADADPLAPADADSTRSGLV